MPKILIKKGRDLKIEGAPVSRVDCAPYPSRVGIHPDEFPGIRPKLAVSEGDKVKIGSTLIYDRNRPDIRIVSPGSGIVSKIVRGKRRALKKIIISTEESRSYTEGIRFDPGSIKKVSRESCIERLLSGGLWPSLRRRPYSLIADPQEKPRSIFINGMMKDPLSQDLAVTLKDKDEAFLAGIEILSKLTDGDVYLSVSDGDKERVGPFWTAANAKIYEFAGPCPSGNTSVHIAHINPLRKNDTVWYISALDTALIGELFLEGVYPVDRIIACSGPSVNLPCHVKTRLGAEISSVLQGRVNEGELRIISGSPLTGFTNSLDGFISFYKNDLTVLPEDRSRKLLGWMLPDFLRPGIGTSTNGSPRAIVASNLYQRYMPMDILAEELIKAVLAENMELAENLGLLECDPEDFALAAYADPSKLDVPQIIARGLTLLRKENE